MLKTFFNNFIPKSYNYNLPTCTFQFFKFLYNISIPLKNIYKHSAFAISYNGGQVSQIWLLKIYKAEAGVSFCLAQCAKIIMMRDREDYT